MLQISVMPKKKSLPAPKIYLTYDIGSHLQLRAYIYQARDLLPMDLDNTSGELFVESFYVMTDKIQAL